MCFCQSNAAVMAARVHTKGGTSLLPPATGPWFGGILPHMHVIQLTPPEAQWLMHGVCHPAARRPPGKLMYWYIEKLRAMPGRARQRAC